MLVRQRVLVIALVAWLPLLLPNGYEELVCKFVQHTMWIAGAMDRTGNYGSPQP